MINCTINEVNTTITFSKDSIILNTTNILFSDLKSIQIKNADFFYIKLNNLVLKFTNLHLRDFIKNICTNQQDLTYFIQYPILINLFQEMNISYQQFINFVKNSFFINLRNEKNVIDRLIAQKMNNCEISFATRINNHSTLQLNPVIVLPDIEKKCVKVDFEPILVFEKKIKNYKKNDFDFEFFKYKECEFEIKKKVKEFFDKLDLEKLIGMKVEKIEDEEFRIFLIKKYGNERVKYLKRLFPEKWCIGEFSIPN